MSCGLFYESWFEVKCCCSLCRYQLYFWPSQLYFWPSRLYCRIPWKHCGYALQKRKKTTVYSKGLLKYEQRTYINNQSVNIIYKSDHLLIRIEKNGCKLTQCNVKCWQYLSNVCREQIVCFLNYIPPINRSVLYKFEDTKGVIRSSKSKKHRPW